MLYLDLHVYLISQNFPTYTIIWTYTSISKALQGELEVNFGNKLEKFHRFLRNFDNFCLESTKWGAITYKKYLIIDYG